MAVPSRPGCSSASSWCWAALGLGCSRSATSATGRNKASNPRRRTATHTTPSSNADCRCHRAALESDRKLCDKRRDVEVTVRGKHLEVSEQGAEGGQRKLRP